jgi:hypothetical protein
MSLPAVSIRAATPADLEAMGRLGALLVRMHHDLDPDRFIAATPQTEHAYGSFLGTRLEEPNIIILVAERDGEVVGYTYAGVEGKDYMSLRGPAGVLYDIVPPGPPLPRAGVAADAGEVAPARSLDGHLQVLEHCVQVSVRHSMLHTRRQFVSVMPPATMRTSLSDRFRTVSRLSVSFLIFRFMLLPPFGSGGRRRSPTKTGASQGEWRALLAVLGVTPGAARHLRVPDQ